MAVKDIAEEELKRFPAENVSWNDCQDYVAKLNQRVMEAGWVYRLPKEGEWELACRGGPRANKYDYAFDFYFEKPTNELWLDQANFAPWPGGGLQRTCKVGSYKPNELGLYDMHGNVWQWCEDLFGGGEPTFASYRVNRGGSWGHGTGDCRASRRSGAPPWARDYYVGLRLARVTVATAKFRKIDPPQPKPSSGVDGYPKGSTTTPPPDKPMPNGPAPLNPPPAVAPFDAVKAKEYQRLWAEYSKVPVEFTNSIGMKFAWIPPGSFLMGSPPSEKGRFDKEGPQHKVTLTKGFWLGVYPVTQAQWQAVMTTNPSYFKGDDNRPVEQVSWEDCQEYCRKLRAREGQTYRLPTEAEWEYACRAGTTTNFYFGDEEDRLGDYAWFGGNLGGHTHPVGQKKANGWGLNDMHGNVFQWCQDSYGPYSSFDQVDTQRPSGGSQRVIRGGSWASTPQFCRSAYRVGREVGGPGSAGPGSDLGFRLALVPSGAGLPDTPAPGAPGGPQAGPGKGPGTSPGESPDDLANQRNKRVIRWSLLFNTKDGHDYANQLADLGAILAFPDGNKPDRFQVVRDLRARPVHPHVEDLTKIKQIWWFENNLDDLKRLAEALGLPKPPSRMIVYFPIEVEKKLLQLELSFRNRPEDQIVETRFEVRRPFSGGKYEPVVISQRP